MGITTCSSVCTSKHFPLSLIGYGRKEAHRGQAGGEGEATGAPQWPGHADGHRELAGPGASRPVNSTQPCSLTRAALCAPGLADCRGFCAKGRCCCSSTKDGEATARLPDRDRSPRSGWLSSAGTSAKAGWSLGVLPTHLETGRTPSLLFAMGRFLAPSAAMVCSSSHPLRHFWMCL